MHREALSAEKPYLVVEEPEPDGNAGQVDTTTVFLTASECPIGCSMCDLYRNTLTTATPPGAIPRQIDVALGDRSLQGGTLGGWIKLYNSGNFFDPRSIPPADYASIAACCEPFSRVVVENHPKFGAHRLRRFRDLINAPLEVAVGLETVQPRWLNRLEKQMSRDDFDRYARWLRNEGVDLRVFVIIGVPGVTAGESTRWARLSARHAIACGARHVSLIPARSGHGWNGRADQLPQLSVDAIAELQQAAIMDAGQRAAITIDLWALDSDADQLKQLAEVNLTQRAGE
jgi:radical SAM enzyme (TIGR01210 family)